MVLCFSLFTFLERWWTQWIPVGCTGDELDKSLPASSCVYAERREGACKNGIVKHMGRMVDWDALWWQVQVREGRAVWGARCRQLQTAADRREYRKVTVNHAALTNFSTKEDCILFSQRRPPGYTVWDIFVYSTSVPFIFHFISGWSTIAPPMLAFLYCFAQVGLERAPWPRPTPPVPYTVTRSTRTAVSPLSRLRCPRLLGPPASVSSVRQDPAKLPRTEVEPDTLQRRWAASEGWRGAAWASTASTHSTSAQLPIVIISNRCLY